MSDEQRLNRLGRQISAATAQRQCFEKRKFNTRNAARDFNARLSADLPDHKPQTPYRCQICGEWRLTSLTKEASAFSRRRNWK